MHERIAARQTQTATGIPERRRYARIEAAWGMTLRWGPRFKWRGQIVSLGPFGLKVRLEGDEPNPPEGTQVSLEFAPPDQKPPMSLKGVVWRVDPDGLAIALLHLSIRDFHRLKSLVDALSIPGPS